MLRELRHQGGFSSSREGGHFCDANESTNAAGFSQVMKAECCVTEARRDATSGGVNLRVDSHRKWRPAGEES
jgi:hypothetical protein